MRNGVNGLDDLTGGVSRVRSDQDGQSLGLNIFLFDGRQGKKRNKASENPMRYGTEQNKETNLDLVQVKAIFGL